VAAPEQQRDVDLRAHLLHANPPINHDAEPGALYRIVVNGVLPLSIPAIGSKLSR
jgi:hypothetical protein